MAQCVAAPAASSMRCLKPSSLSQLRRSAASAVSSRRSMAVAASGSGTGSYSGAGIAPPAKGHHFLHIDDFSKEQLSEWMGGWVGNG